MLYELKGKEYALKSLDIEDISEDYLSWLNDPEVNRFLDVRHNPPRTKEAAAEHLSSYDGKMRFYWGIYNIVNNELIGTITLCRNLHETASFGYLIGNKKYWGTGAAIESIALVLDYAFEVLKLRKVWGGANEKNVSSLFNFKKLGFVHEGILRQAELLDDTVTDGYLFGILKSEWGGRRRQLNL